jgi:hypothetical protein
MRHLKWLALALVLAVPGGKPATAAMAAPISGPAIEQAGSPNLIEAAVRCGPRAHYIRGHRARNHQWIKGRCVRDRRR